MSLRRLGVAVTAICAALSTAFVPHQASAVQTPQPRVVSADPAGYTPHVLDGQVKSIVQVGSTILLGGAFTQVSSADGNTVYNRANIVAFNATTGAVSTTFNPQIDGEVTTLLVAPDGASVYAGGFFNTVNGTPSKSLAKISLATGQLTCRLHGARDGRPGQGPPADRRTALGGRPLRLRRRAPAAGARHAQPRHRRLRPVPAASRSPARATAA